MKYLILVLVIGVAFLSQLSAGDRQEISLKGKWRFEIGDNLRWSQTDFDDSKWDAMYVPSRWEDHDYPGYDGYAWYRRWVYVPTSMQSEILFLVMGFIDDVDQTFVNGHLIGSTGNFPPNYQTAYNMNRKYYLPREYIKFGEKNLIAVKVYDVESAGGITGGNPGFYSVRGRFVPEFDLGGFWKFKTGDDKAWANPQMNDKDWDEIIVPGFWEGQGYADYDGFAWYRKHFRLPKEMDSNQLVIMLGKIDDVDQVYINGKRIGSTGPMPEEVYRGEFGNWYQIERIYSIPAGIVQKNADNVIAVRVFDAWIGGGFYDIPVGITTKRALKEDKRARNSGDWNIGDILIRILDE